MLEYDFAGAVYHGAVVMAIEWTFFSDAASASTTLKGFH